MTDADQSAGSSSILSSSAVMAAGTVVSRLSGFVRSALLVAALGASLHADIFNIANTIPNMLYILLAGGVVNAVLVPQLVRAQKFDADGGAGYTNRVVTLAGLLYLSNQSLTSSTTLFVSDSSSGCARSCFPGCTITAPILVLPSSSPFPAG